MDGGLGQLLESFNSDSGQAAGSVMRTVGGLLISSISHLVI